MFILHEFFHASIYTVQSIFAFYKKTLIKMTHTCSLQESHATTASRPRDAAMSKLLYG